jgi:SPP1 family predicted phage head-tail adaptor
MIKSGDLDRIITIQAATQTPGAFNTPVTTWADYLSDIAAAVQPLGGRELFVAAQVNSKATHKFIIRWRDGITEKHRIHYDGKYWDLAAPVEIGRREGLAIQAWAASERDQ